MMITDFYPDQPRRNTMDGPIYGRGIKIDCPICGMSIETLIAEDCPDDWAQMLLPGVVCDDCGDLKIRMRKAREILGEAKSEMSLRDRSIKTCERRGDTDNYPGRISEHESKQKLAREAAALASKKIAQYEEILIHKKKHK